MFFSTKDNIPNGVGFSTFGLTHLIWLLAIAGFFTIVILAYRKASPKKRNIIRIVIAVLILSNEIIKDIAAAFVGDLDADHLPLHLCGINILLIGFDLLKQTKIVRNFLYYFCIPGALLALLFPNWTALPCMNFFSIHSFSIHALLVLYPVILVVGEDVTPEIKAMPKCLLLLVAMAIPIYFINIALNTNFMFLMEPETGNPLGLFEKYMGSHLFGFPILLPVVMFIMYIPISLISKHKSKNVKLETAPKKQSVLSSQH